MDTTIFLDLYVHPEAVYQLEKHYKVIQNKPDSQSKVETVNGENAAAAIVSSSWKLTADILNSMLSIKVIGRPGIGVDNIDIEAATRLGIAVVNTPEAPSISTAEHTVALIMALAKRHKPAARLLSTGASFTSEPKLIELGDKVLGLVGLGRIGKKVAQICGMGLGMKLIAYDPYVSHEDASVYRVTLYQELYPLLRVADVVSLHCPLLKNTIKLINEEALSVMKPTAFLINCARGVIVDEKALFQALDSGKIAGAGLDVFENEPPLPTNPLFKLENVVATPHTAGFTEDAQRKMCLGMVKGVMDVLNGIRPSNLVNPTVWDSRKLRVERADSVNER